MPKPTTFADRYPITCTDTVLTVRQTLPNLAPEISQPLEDWLTEHHLDVNRIPVGRPITRDPRAGTLTYWVRNRGDLDAMQVIDQAPLTAAKGTWPAPFPAVLQEQPAPSVCPTCGRDTKARA